jgi:hypothetical protein
MNERLSLSVALVALGLTGCFGSSTTGSPAPDADVPPSEEAASPGPEDAGTPASNDAQAPDGSVTSTPDATTPDAAPQANGAGAGLYVSQAANQVLVFAPDATGNAAPVRTISGASTGLALPIGVAVDASGNLYVANRMGAGVTVYPPGASGDVAPLRTLAASGMQAAEGIAIGKNGDVFVSTCPSCGNSGGGQVGVFHFPAGATQSDYSIAGQNTGFTDPGSIALDADQDLVVGNSFGGTVSTFAPGATGNATPIGSFTPTPTTNLQAIAFADATLFVATPDGLLSLFSPSATGDAMAAATFSSLSVEYPAGVAIDTTTAQPVVYLVDTSGGVINIIQTTGSAPMFAPGTVTTIQGTATGLQTPLGIAIVR